MPLAQLVLSAWLGAAILFAAVVAPAAFAVLPSRFLAGALVGRVLPVLFIAGIIVGALGLWLDRPTAGRLPTVRRVALVALALSCAVAQFGVGRRLERVRAEIPGAIEDLSPTDPRRVRFGRLHAISVAWLGLAMLAAGATITLGSLGAAMRRAPLTEPSTVPSH